MRRKDPDRLIREDYNFFRNHALNNTTFTMQEYMDYRSLTRETAETYKVKRWKGFIAEIETDKFKVSRKFLKVSFKDFAINHRQAVKHFPDYGIEEHKGVMVFEFFLPLTREHQLRHGLDNLFYEDSLKDRLKEVGTGTLSKAFPMGDMEENAYLNHIVEKVGKAFVGYSIHHVSGRFRVGDEVISREMASKKAEKMEPYLVDETSAIVRFIIPLKSAGFREKEIEAQADESKEVKDTFELLLEDLDEVTERTVKESLANEAREIRKLFYLVFVGAVILTLKDEVEVWLLESGYDSRLTKWVAKD